MEKNQAIPIIVAQKRMVFLEAVLSMPIYAYIYTSKICEAFYEKHVRAIFKRSFAAKGKNN